MKRTWAISGVGLVVLAVAALALTLVFTTGDGGTPRAQPGSSPSPTPAVSPGPSAQRVVLPGLAHDEPARVVVTDLSRDRPDPERLVLWVGGDSTAVYMGQSLTAAARALGGSV